jgi:hypothetical protein
MDPWLIASITVFIIIISSIVIYGTVYKREIHMRQILNSLRRERCAYLREERKAVHQTLCTYPLTIYLDEELDHMHEVARREYEKEGLEYLYHLEKSYELVMLHGHRLSLDMPLANQLIADFCLDRHLLLLLWLEEAIRNKEVFLIDFSKEARKSIPIVEQRRLILYVCKYIVCFMKLLMKPKLDVTTAKAQRLQLLKDGQ